MLHHTRRKFLKEAVGGLAAGGGCLSVRGSASLQVSARKTTIVNVRIGNSVRVPNCSGDLWTTTWGDDDKLYSVTDDTTGFDNACKSNLAVNLIDGGPPPNLLGSTVNPMKEFGGFTELREDGASWKASGLICLGGVLYLAVSRHRYDGVGDTSGDADRHFWIQETWDASIVKSTDHGRTWTPVPKLGQAMFPGRIFSNPFFVQYGKDGDGIKDFVYAVSNDGTWNNGNWIALGRVPRRLIGQLDPRDWEFVHGFDDNGEPIWKPRHDSALYIFRSPGRASMTGVHYFKGLNLYIMPQWHYPHLVDDPRRRWKVTRWELYSAPAPWGPWTLFHVQDFEPQGFYNPSIPSKFISEDGCKFWIFAAGDFTNQGPNNLYGLNVLPVSLETQTG